MSRVPYTNTTETGHYIGNTFVPAGGTRTVDSNNLASSAAAAAPLAEPDDPLKELAAGPVKAIVAALPTMDAEACDALLALEHEGKKRGTAIEAIGLRKLEILDEADQAAQAAAAASAAAASNGGEGAGGAAADGDQGGGAAAADGAGGEGQAGQE